MKLHQQNRINTVPAEEFFKGHLRAVLEHFAFKAFLAVKIRKKRAAFIKDFYFRASPVRFADCPEIKKLRILSRQDVKKRLQHFY